MSRSTLPIQHCPNVTVLVLFLKKDVLLLHLVLLHPPQRSHCRERSVRDDEREAQRQLDTCRDEEREASAQVVAELAALDVGASKMRTDSLRMVIEWAEEFQRDQEAKAERLKEMRETIQGARVDVKRRRHERQRAQSAAVE